MAIPAPPSAASLAEQHLNLGQVLLGIRANVIIEPMSKEPASSFRTSLAEWAEENAEDWGQ